MDWGMNMAAMRSPSSETELLFDQILTELLFAVKG